MRPILATLLAVMTLPVVGAPSSPEAKARSETPSGTATIDSYRNKVLREDVARTAAMEHALGLAKAALTKAKEGKDPTRVALCERRLAILTERLDLLRQIRDFRQQKWNAERRGDARAWSEAQRKIDVAYQLMESHKAEERNIRRQLEAPAKSK